MQVREDAAAGTVVARLAVRDDDVAGAALSYFVAAGDARARFQVRAAGELYVARALDREAEPAYSLSVAATDGKFTAYTAVHITVLDVNGDYFSTAKLLVHHVCGIFLMRLTQAPVLFFAGVFNFITQFIERFN